jgi:enediyne biosynthesis protein E4
LKHRLRWGIGALLAVALLWQPLARGDASRAAETSTPFHFVDVAAQVGLTRVILAGRPGKDHLLDSAGTGAAWLDFDNDGRLDLYLVNDWRIEGSTITERGKNALYHQRRDGTFEDVTDAAGVAGEGQWGAGAFAVDYDADGWTDIFITNFGRNVLYRNLGNGRFENVAAKVGLEAPGWNTGAAFFDADGDGDLDVYVAQYIDCTLDEVLKAKPTLDWRGLEKVAVGPFGLKGAPDFFFRNDGGHFVDVTAASGLEDKGLAFGFPVRAADFDDDGDLDLYVANDSDPNYLYRNEGGGHFKEIGVWSQVALDGNGMAQASMGIGVGDVSGDGLLDMVVTAFSEDFTTFYRGIGGGFFEDASRETGLGPITYRALSWSAVLPDLDNDGDLDLVIANGHIFPQIDRHPEFIGTYRQKSLLIENRLIGGNVRPGGELLFRDVTEQAGPGFQLVRSHRGVAMADYDNDGDLDLLITALDEPPALLRNDSRTGSWLIVDCQIPGGMKVPVGTSVTVTVGGRRLWRDVAVGDSYMSTHDPRCHFGLGTAERVEQIDVRWPDGTHTLLKDVPARQILVVRKETRAAAKPKP